MGDNGRSKQRPYEATDGEPFFCRGQSEMWKGAKGQKPLPYNLHAPAMRTFDGYLG
jgi:hypothetical protein